MIISHKERLSHVEKRSWLEITMTRTMERVQDKITKSQVRRKHLQKLVMVDRVHIQYKYVLIDSNRSIPSTLPPEIRGLQCL